jgi:LysR family glycine cleavage system transcriptional activator
MRQNLPSISSLLAIEAAARHLSFTRAAIELNLTQGAISQRIKALEDMLGVQLFIRDRNQIRLTEVGRTYVQAARTAITEVIVATERTIDQQRGDVLTVGCLGTFGLKCLIPNLKHFRQRHPKIALRIRTLVPYENRTQHDYDVSIQYGASDWRGLVAEKIGPEEVFPVCSAELLKTGNGLKTPADLRHHTIIRTASPFILRDDWPLWLEAAGIPDISFADEISCDLLYPSYQAAIEGLGVAMGRTVVVQADLQLGRLVEPFSIRLPTPLGYYVVTTPERARLNKVQHFFEWVRETFADKPAMAQHNPEPLARDAMP